MLGAPCVRVRAGPGVAAGSVAWRWRGSLRVSAIVKATYSFERGVLERVQAAPLAARDEPLGAQPQGSLARACETAPALGGVDVLCTGHAYAPAGRPAPHLVVGLELTRGGERLLDKRLDLVGARRADGQREPFVHAPLVWERTARGAEPFVDPVGLAPGDERAPFFVDRSDASRPAGLAPIPRSWRVRAALLGGTDAAVLDTEPVSLPKGFEFSYFRAAPNDQRLPRLRGDERIVLHHLHPQAPELALTLLGDSGHARLHGPGLAGGRAFELSIDMLVLDTDRRLLHLVWRGNQAIAEPLAEHWLDAWLEVAGAAGARPAAVATAPAADAGASAGTMMLGTGDIQTFDGPREGTVMLQTGDISTYDGTLESHATFEGRPAASLDAPVPTSTVAVSPAEAARLRAGATLPFRAGAAPPPGAAAKSVASTPVVDTGTVGLSADEVAELRRTASTPFPRKPDVAAMPATPQTRDLSDAEVEALRRSVVTPFRSGAATPPPAGPRIAPEAKVATGTLAVDEGASLAMPPSTPFSSASRPAFETGSASRPVVAVPAAPPAMPRPAPAPPPPAYAAPPPPMPRPVAPPPAAAAPPPVPRPAPAPPAPAAAAPGVARPTGAIADAFLLADPAELGGADDDLPTP